MAKRNAGGGSGDLNYDIFVDLSTRGAAQSEQEISDWTAALDKALKAGQITQKQAEQVSKAIVSAARSFRAGAKDVGDYADSFNPLVKQLQEFKKAYKANVQDTVGKGVKLPSNFDGDITGLSRGELEDIIKVSDAMNANLVSAARQRIKASDETGRAIESNERRTQAALRQTLQVQLDLAKAREGRADKAIGGQWDAEFKNAEAEAKARARGVQEEVTATKRYSDALDARLKAEQALNRERKQRDRSAAKQAFEEESRAAQQATRSVEEYHASLESQRYANYDIARTLFTVSAAIVATGTAAVVAFADWESGMAGVERTSGLAGDSLASLEQELIGLADTLPISTQEILDMATRAGQLGVAAEDIDEFTATMAKLIAISDTLEASTGVESIARLGNLTGTRDWEGLASSIALVGVNSAATDAQIVKTAQEVAQAGAAANFAADDVIGLAAAFASLGVPPERARSVLQDLIAVMNNGLAGANDSIQQTADLMGIAAGEAANLWQTDPAQFLQNLIPTLATVDNLTVTLSDLGLEGKRAQPVFAALTKDYINSANGASVLNNALSDSRKGFEEQTEVNRQFSIVLQTLASQWQLFINSVVTLGAKLGEAIAPEVSALLDNLTRALQGFRDFLGTEAGQTVSDIAFRLAAVVATFAALRGAIALATATTIAFKVAMSGVAGAGIISSMRNLGLAIGFVDAASGKATFSVATLRAGLIALGRATVILALIQGAAELIFNFGGAINAMRQPIHFFIDAFYAIRNAIVGAGQTLAQFIGMLPGAGVFKDWGVGLSDFQKTLAQNDKKVHKQLDSWIDSFQATDKAVKSLSGNGSMGIGVWNEYTESLEGADDATSGLGGSSGAAQKQIRTLVDYANDLSSVWSRAFEIRFSGQSTLDAVTSGFMAIAEATAEAERNITTLKADILGLQSDIRIQEYFLSIAVEYKDAKRAEAITANLAKLNADLATKNEALEDAQAGQNKSLVGNTKAAIANRATITQLVTQYQAHLQALAASGMEQGQLAAATAQLRADFVAQATQLGYNSSELEIYAAAFDDVALAIAAVPRNITVTANVNPAIQALNELEARAAQVGASLGGALGGGLGAGNDAVERALKRRANLMQLNAALANAMMETVEAAASGNRLGTAYWNAVASVLRNNIITGNYAEGGYTGAGGKYEAAGIVHKGEYVIPKKYVNQSTGLPHADALGRLTRGSTSPRGYANGGTVRSGMGAEVALTAGTIQAIAHAVQPYLVLDGKLVGQSASNQYARETVRGNY